MFADNGSDAANLSLSARRDGDHFILNGTKVRLQSEEETKCIFLNAIYMTSVA